MHTMALLRHIKNIIVVNATDSENIILGEARQTQRTNTNESTRMCYQEEGDL